MKFKEGWKKFWSLSPLAQIACVILVFCLLVGMNFFIQEVAWPFCCRIYGVVLSVLVTYIFVTGIVYILWPSTGKLLVEIGRKVIELPLKAILSVLGEDKSKKKKKKSS